MINLNRIKDAQAVLRKYDLAVHNFRSTLARLHLEKYGPAFYWDVEGNGGEGAEFMVETYVD